MRSVADELRREDRLRADSLTPAERVRLALELGRRDVERFRLAHTPPLAREEAIRRLRRERQHGRVRSKCMDDLDG